MRPIFKPPAPLTIDEFPIPTDDSDLPPRRFPRPPPVVKHPQNKSTKAGPAGSDTYYSSSFDHIVFKLRLLGATTERIAYILGVTQHNLERWIRENMSLREAWNNGGDFADADVAHSLYQRAIGYQHEDTRIFYNSAANNGEGDIIYAPYTKHYPPDTGAAQFWLNNRNRAKWKNQQTTELTGADGRDLIPPKLQINFVPSVPRAETKIIDVEPIVQDE